MRSKEVEEAINYFENKYKEFEQRLGKKVTTEEHDYIEILNNYTSELEKENKFLRDENNIYKNETVSKSVIRDVIKDIEKQIKGEKANKYTIPGCFLILHILEEILEK